MKEYKLLQKYPSLPKDWEVGMLVGKGCRYHTYSPCHGKYKDFYIDKEVIENSPEFWELQVEKSYEIIKTCYIHKKGVQIFGVKRLSDNVEFSVGDYLEKNKQIVGIVQRGKRQIWLQDNLDNLTHGICLSVAEKLEPLFISEEGLPVFKGDVVWVSQRCGGNYTNVLEFYAEHVSNGIKSKYFAKKENAEKFIEDHAKTYTLNEVVKVVNNWSMCEINEKDVIKYFNK